MACQPWPLAVHGLAMCPCLLVCHVSVLPWRACSRALCMPCLVGQGRRRPSSSLPAALRRTPSQGSSRLRLGRRRQLGRRRRRALWRAADSMTHGRIADFIFRRSASPLTLLLLGSSPIIAICIYMLVPLLSSFRPACRSAPMRVPCICVPCIWANCIGPCGLDARDRLRIVRAVSRSLWSPAGARESRAARRPTHHGRGRPRRGFPSYLAPSLATSRRQTNGTISAILPQRPSSLLYLIASLIVTYLFMRGGSPSLLAPPPAVCCRVWSTCVAHVLPYIL